MLININVSISLTYCLFINEHNLNPGVKSKALNIKSIILSFYYNKVTIFRYLY